MPRQRTKSDYLTYVRNGEMIWVKLAVLAIMVHLLISMQQMLGTTAKAINHYIMMLTDLTRLVTNILLMTVHSLMKLSMFSVVIAQNGRILQHTLKASCNLC